MSRLHAVVHGRVQGVGFRATTVAEARRLGVAGWVRNRSDGTVEVAAEGEEPTLKQLLAFLHEGPPGAHVRAVNASWWPVEGAPFPFESRRTE